MSHPELEDVQRRVVGLIAHEKTGEEALVVGNEIASAAERFAVYREGYVSRLVECLADDYAAVRLALGADAFDRMARRYVERFPSASFSLNGYGQRFPDFLAELSTEGGVVELAHFEWAIVEVIHAPNVSPVPAAAPGAIAPPAAASPAAASPAAVSPAAMSPAGVRLMGGPAVRLFPTTHRVAEYYRLLLHGQPTAPVPNQGYGLVTRRDYAVFKLDVEPEPGRVLDQLLQGRSLEAALEGVTASPDAVQGWFAEWVRLGALKLG